MDDNFNKLYEEFLALTQAGDDDVARKFLSDHISEFPEDTRNEILFAFFEEELLKRADAIEENAIVKQEGLRALEILQKAKKDLENEARIQELKDGLGAK